MGFVQNRVQLISQTVIQRQVGSQLEAVLREDAIAGKAEVTVRITDKLQRAVGKPKSEIDKRTGNVSRIPHRICARSIVEAAERDLPVEGEIIESIQLCIPNIAADLKRVSRGGTRQIINPLKGIGRRPVRLVDAAPQMGHCSTAGHEACRERQHRNIAKIQGSTWRKTGVESKCRGLRPCFRD